MRLKFKALEKKNKKKKEERKKVKKTIRISIRCRTTGQKLVEHQKETERQEQVKLTFHEEMWTVAGLRERKRFA